MKTIVERLKICWYALTKKYYAFYCIDDFAQSKSNAKCFITDMDKNHRYVFLGSINDYNEKLM